MKPLFTFLLTLFFVQVYAQSEPTIQSDTVDTDILKWVEVTKSFGYKPSPVFPDIRSQDGVLKTKREISGDVISWIEEVNRLYYQAMQDSAYLYLQKYCSSLDSSETENTTYKKVVGDQIFAVFGCDLSPQMNQLPSIKANDQTEVELVHKYLFEYFETAHFKKGSLNISFFDENVKPQFPFLNALYQISQLIK